MATGLAAATANAILDALCRSVAWSEPASFNLKLHTGDPGSAGTANAFGDTTRKAVTFGAASGGVISNSAQAQWTSLSAAGTITHVSIWDDISAGNFIGSDALTNSRVVGIGDTLTAAIGDIDLSLPVAA
jgi:hypothetical protein